MRIFMKNVLASIFLLLTSAVGWASTSCSISGVVADTSGGVIAGARVTATETQTNVRNEITTDGAGSYNFPTLPIGVYDVEVAAAGFRDTRITENKMLELRFEAFNIFNHAQFQNPNGNIDQSTFGLITAANDPRILQIAAKFSF